MLLISSFIVSRHNLNKYNSQLQICIKRSNDIVIILRVLDCKSKQLVVGLNLEYSLYYCWISLPFCASSFAFQSLLSVIWQNSIKNIYQQIASPIKPVNFKKKTET